MSKELVALEEVRLPWGWWLDLSLRGGVAKRVGWWVTGKKYRVQYYVVVFRDGTRGPVTEGTSPWEELTSI